MFPSQSKIKRQIYHLINVHQMSEAVIRPHFFLTGPSGSGKSFLTKQVCQSLEIPFFEVNAAQLTAEGLSGNSLSKAMRPLREHWNTPNVCFVDEFDKLFQRNGEQTENFRSIVQDEFLHVLEAKNASIFTDYGKYEPIKVENTMFIFAGAFSGQKIESIDELKAAGLRTEFVGRVPLVFATTQVTLPEMYTALPKTDLFNQYLKVYPEIRKTDALREIKKIMESQAKQADIGVRLISSATHQFFMKDV